MKRREFMALVGGAAVAATSPVRAQQPAMQVVGFLNGASADGYVPMVLAFRQGLKQAGYVEGQNVAIEFRWADGHYDRLPAMAADLVRRQVSVIAATSTPANLIAKAATGTIPIVFTTAGDPVQLGLIASLNRPGGNVTGVTQLNVEVSPKRLELARELVPGVTIVALLVNPANPSAETISQSMQAAARVIGLQLQVLHASSESELENAFAKVRKLGAGVLVIGADAFFNDRNQLLAELSLRHAVPAIFHYPEFTAAGGLMSYGGSIKESYRTAGALAGRILKGARPADLPVQQSTTVELIINLKTAKALGITVPLSLLGRADHVIE
ncbi:MAG TPA: ABC transporter substrate-binding protein [Bradyrhizobium sp.]|nr:ABC transporter substrate-binding protein [Bradyrhizobium sp.]